MARKEGTALNCNNEVTSVFMLHSVTLNRSNTGRNIFFYLCFISTKAYTTDKRSVVKSCCVVICECF